MPSKTFLRHINVLNALLMTSLVVFFFSLLLPLSGVKGNYTLPAPKEAAKDKQEPHAQIQKPSMAEYAVIAEQNVFSPERKIPSEKADEKPLPKPEFVLYGTLITTDTSIAFLEDLKAPYTTAGRGKRQRTLRLGGNLSGYILSQIYQDRVVMLRGEDKLDIRVLDHKRGRRSETPAAQPPAVQTPPARTISPAATFQDKPKGSGRPPGVVHEGPPPPDIQAPSKEELNKVRDAFGSVIKEKLGSQQKQAK